MSPSRRPIVSPLHDRDRPFLAPQSSLYRKLAIRVWRVFQLNEAFCRGIKDAEDAYGGAETIWALPYGRR